MVNTQHCHHQLPSLISQWRRSSRGSEWIWTVTEEICCSLILILTHTYTPSHTLSLTDCFHSLTLWINWRFPHWRSLWQWNRAVRDDDDGSYNYSHELNLWSFCPPAVSLFQNMFMLFHLLLFLSNIKWFDLFSDLYIWSLQPLVFLLILCHFKWLLMFSDVDFVWSHEDQQPRINYCMLNFILNSSSNDKVYKFSFDVMKSK